MTWLSKYAFEDDVETIVRGLQYYAVEYEDLLDGTPYVAWDIPLLHWERPSSQVISIYIVLFMSSREEWGEIANEIKSNVIDPSGWEIIMTSPGDWAERDGEKYSVIRFDVERK